MTSFSIFQDFVFRVFLLLQNVMNFYCIRVMTIAFISKAINTLYRNRMTFASHVSKLMIVIRRVLLLNSCRRYYLAVTKCCLQRILFGFGSVGGGKHSVQLNYAECCEHFCE